MDAAAFGVESPLSDPPHAVSVKETAMRATFKNPIFRMPFFLFLIPLESAATETGRRARTTYLRKTGRSPVTGGT